MRLIDADSIHYTRVLSQQGLNMELAAKVVIDDMPTIDAAPVVHGRWENIANYGCGNCYGYCSECRSEVRAENATALKMANNFCSYCGARMDKEE